MNTFLEQSLSTTIGTNSTGISQPPFISSLFAFILKLYYWRLKITSLTIEHLCAQQKPEIGGRRSVAQPKVKACNQGWCSISVEPPPIPNQRLSPLLNLFLKSHFFVLAFGSVWFVFYFICYIPITLPEDVLVVIAAGHTTSVYFINWFACFVHK